MATINAEYLLREGSGTTANDTSGNGHNGTLINVPNLPQWVSNGLLFDGTNNCAVRLPDAVLAFDNTSILAASIEVWFQVYPGKQFNVTNIAGEIVTLDDADFAIALGNSTTAGGIGLVDGDCWSFVASSFVHQGDAFSTLPADGQFHHLVLTYDAANIKIYYDGVLQTTLAVAAPGDALALGTSAGSKAIGADTVNNFKSVAGIVGEVRIWNGALSAGDVTTQYNSTKSRYPLSTSVLTGTVGPYANLPLGGWAMPLCGPTVTNSPKEDHFGIKYLFEESGVLYTITWPGDPLNHFSATKLAMSTSADGVTWSTLDGPNGPQLNIAGNAPSAIAMDDFGGVIYVLHGNPTAPSAGTITGLRVSKFDTGTGLWGTQTVDIPNTADSSTDGAARSWGLHVTGANEFNVVYCQSTGGVTSAAVIMSQVRYTGGTWGAATVICTDITSSTLMGFWVDRTNNVSYLHYSQAYAATTPISPNPTKVRTIDSAGTLSAAQTVIADAQPLFMASTGSPHYGAYPTFGPGVVCANGNRIVPLAYGSDAGVPAPKTIPAVVVNTGSGWNLTELTNPGVDESQWGDPGAIITAIIDDSGAVWVVYAPLGNATDPATGDSISSLLNYSKSTDSGVTWSNPATTRTLYSPNIIPAPWTDQSSGSQLPNAVVFNGGIGVMAQFLETLDNWLLASFFSPGAPAPGLTLACPVSNTGIVGTSYSSSLTATGGTLPYTFSIIGGALPPGLSLNTSSGLISGLPTLSGTFTYTAQVMDFVGATATATCSIVITSPGMCETFPITTPTPGLVVYTEPTELQGS